MLVVKTIAKIRRAHFIQGKSIKQICREFLVSRNTARKVIRPGGTEFSYNCSTQPRPKIDPWRSELDEMLAENVLRPKQGSLTGGRIYEELRNRGYDGSYAAVRRYAASWSMATREASADAHVLLSFDPGEAYQFDWSQEDFLIDGATTTVNVAHVRLCHSRMPFVRAYPCETQEMVADAHDKAFAFFGGAWAIRPILKGFSGILQVEDGCAGYNRLLKRTNQGIALAYCRAHARRKLREVAQNSTVPIAEDGLKQIAVPYRIEGDIRGQSPEARLAARRAGSAPKIAAFEAWLTEHRACVSSKSPLGEALKYIATYWDGLALFPGDDRIEIGSNAVERTILPIALSPRMPSSPDTTPARKTGASSLRRPGPANSTAPIPTPV